MGQVARHLLEYSIGSIIKMHTGQAVWEEPPPNHALQKQSQRQPQSWRPHRDGIATRPLTGKIKTTCAHGDLPAYSNLESVNLANMTEYRM